MLHWGYFENPDIAPETISIQQVEDAQIKYAELIIDQVINKNDVILDVGCGMGGLSKLLTEKGYAVEALTPNDNQKNYIKIKQPNLTVHHCIFEDLKTTKKYGTIINSESLQYIALDKAFENVNKLILPGGRWIITDYFRTKEHGINKSSHTMEKFQDSIKQYGWKIVHQQDITPNVMPTIRLVYMYADRFLVPIKDLAYEKLRYKQGWLYYLTTEIREKVTGKITKELASVDPKQFLDEKKYMLYVLEKA